MGRKLADGPLKDQVYTALLSQPDQQADVDQTIAFLNWGGLSLTQEGKRKVVRTQVYRLRHYDQRQIKTVNAGRRNKGNTAYRLVEE